MQSLPRSLYRFWLFQVSKKYCLDSLSHRSDPIFTNCDNIWVGTGGLCFHWFLLSSPRPSKGMHNLYKWIHTSVIVFHAACPVLCCPTFYCLIFFLLQFLKKGRKKVLLVEAWLPSEAARIFHRFVLWYTVSVNMQRQATLFCRVETWGGTCQRLYMWFQILRYWFSDRKWCRVCQISENLCGCFSTCNRSIYSIINNFAQLFGCGYCQWVCCIWWLTW